VGTHKGHCVGVVSTGINSRGEVWPHLGLNNLITNVLRMTECSLVLGVYFSISYSQLQPDKLLKLKLKHRFSKIVTSTVKATF